MKKLYKIKLLVIAFLLGFGSIKAQTDIVQFLNAGVDDAEILFTEYLRPFGAGFGTGMTGGWYNTGKPHKLLGFDLTVTANIATIPTTAETFDLADFAGDFSSIQIGTGTTETSTIFGPGTTEARLGYLIDLTQDIPGVGPVTATMDNPDAFPAPPGIGLKDDGVIPMYAVPVPMVQLGVGLIKNTELNFRFLPKIELGDMGELNLWGIGVKHDILQWLPIVDKVPVDVSIQAGYTKFKTLFNAIEYNPVLNDGNPGYMSTIVDGGLSPIDYDDQNLELAVSGFTMNAIVSKKLAILTLYGSLGFYSSNFGIYLNGDYPIPVPEINISDPLNPAIDLVVSDDNVQTDPFAIDIKETNFRAGAGFRLKLAILTLHADYYLQEYNMFTVGIGFSFR
jgi:Family of unknown function (DUF6588)